MVFIVGIYTAAPDACAAELAFVTGAAGPLPGMGGFRRLESGNLSPRRFGALP